MYLRLLNWSIDRQDPASAIAMDNNDDLQLGEEPPKTY